MWYIHLVFSDSVTPFSEAYLTTFALSSGKKIVAPFLFLEFLVPFLILLNFLEVNSLDLGVNSAMRRVNWFYRTFMHNQML